MTQARYRFFAHPRVTPAAIVATHRGATIRRGAEHLVILAVQDPMTLNLPLHYHTLGLNPIGQAALAGGPWGCWAG